VAKFPSIAKIRETLEFLGLPQVDPSAWYGGTMPELLRVTLNAGAIVPPIVSVSSFDQTFTTPSSTDTSFTIATAQNDGLVLIIKDLAITVNTGGNIDELRFGFIDPGATERRHLWRDFTNGPFPAGPYNFDNSDETRAWGARGLNSIVMYPDTLNTFGERSLEMRIISGVAAVKAVNLDWTEIRVRPEDFVAGASF